MKENKQFKIKEQRITVKFYENFCEKHTQHF